MAACLSCSFGSLASAQYSPANGVVQGGSSVTFSWPDFTGGASVNNYVVQVAFTIGDLGVGAPFQNNTVGPVQTLTVIGLPDDGSELFWQVVALNSFSEEIATSPAQNFINGSSFTLATPIPYKPADGSVVPIGSILSLGWERVDRANSYIVQIDDNAGLTSPDESEVFGMYAAGPSTSAANAGEQYFWKVRAVYTPPDPSAPVEMSDFSAVQTFTIGQADGPDIDAITATPKFTVGVPDAPTDTRQIILINRGDEDLNITGAAQQPGAPWLSFSFTESDGTTPLTLPKTLARNARIKMSISVDGSSLTPPTTEVGTIDIASNDPDENPFAITVTLCVLGNPPPMTCSPADMAPYGNNDGIVSTSESNAYLEAYTNGEHDDLNGTLEAYNLAINGGICPGFGVSCDELSLTPSSGTVCIDTTSSPPAPFTFTVGQLSSSANVSAKLQRFSGSGKVRVTKVSDMSEVLGPDDTESMDLIGDLVNGPVEFAVEGVETGFVSLFVELVNSGTGSDVTCPGHLSLIQLTIIRVDLDVDSDNTNATPDFGPDRDDTEEMLENDTGSMGRIIRLNDDDDDADGVTDLGDGYNLDCSDDTCAFSNTTYNVTGALAGDISMIDLSGRGFDTFFTISPADQIVQFTSPTDWEDELEAGRLWFRPTTGPGNYSFNVDGFCGTNLVELTVNVNVTDGFSAFPASLGGDVAVGQTGRRIVWELEHRLSYFNMPTLGTNPPGEGPNPPGVVTVDGDWDTADGTALQIFSHIVMLYGPTANNYSTNLSQNSVIHQWLSAQNAPRWTDHVDSPAGLFHPDFDPVWRTLATNWNKKTVDDAVVNRPQLIRDSPGARSGKIAMVHGSMDYSALTIPALGHFYSWALDVNSLLPSGGDDGSFPTTGQQALIDDITAFIEAGLNAGSSTSRIEGVLLRVYGGDITLYNRVLEVMSEINTTYGSNTVTSGFLSGDPALSFMSIYSGAPPMDAPAGPQALSIN